MYGQMSLKTISTYSDYLQLDICGLNVKESLNRYISYNTNIPIILHGDWSKKGVSENNLDLRYNEYIEIINELKKCTAVYGLTIHPPLKNKISLDDTLIYIDKIKNKTHSNVFLENRSNLKYNFSNPLDVVNYSEFIDVTVDIPQLFIACSYNEDYLIEILSKIKNIKELHLGNLKTQVYEGKRKTNIGIELDKGVLDYNRIFGYVDLNVYKTIEVLGGVSTFENCRTYVEAIKYNLDINKDINYI